MRLGRSRRHPVNRRRDATVDIAIRTISSLSSLILHFKLSHDSATPFTWSTTRNTHFLTMSSLSTTSQHHLPRPNRMYKPNRRTVARLCPARKASRFLAKSRRMKRFRLIGPRLPLHFPLHGDSGEKSDEQTDGGYFGME